MPTIDVVAIKSKRILYLTFATLTLLVLGLIYAWSIFATPIEAAYSDYKPLLPQVFQVSMFAFCVSALFGAQLIKLTSTKVTIIVAAALLGVGFVATAYGAALGVWSLFLFYGIFAASGCGIAYNAIISLVNPWFPDKIGLCSGILMMGFGLSSLVFGSLANALFGVMDWTAVFIIIAIAGVVLLVALATVVKPAPQDIALTLGMTGASAQAKKSPTKDQNILATKGFWLYSVWATLIIACGLTLVGTAAQGATQLKLDVVFYEGFPALLVGLVSTMNGVGRIINGSIFDKFGLIPVMLIAALVAFATTTMLAIALATGIAGFYVVGAVLITFSYGSVPVMASAYSRKRHNAADFAKNLGIANCNIASAALINILLSAMLGPATEANGPVIYGILAGFGVVAFSVSFAFAKTYRSDLAQIDKELA